MAKMKSVNALEGTNSGGVFLPNPTIEEFLAKDLEKRFPNLGRENVARVGRNWFTSSIEQEIDDGGWVQSRGPMPSCETGAASLIDGNGRLTVLARKAKADPEKWGNVKVQVAVYPVLKDEQRAELIARAGRSTAPFTEQDYYKQSMLTWLAHPGDSYIQHLTRMGVERAMLFFTPCPEACLIRDDKGLRLKPGVKDEDLWGKGKGGQKQGPIQVGEVLARAHPRARQAFFDQFGDDPAHAISYKELVEVTKEWEQDRKLRPDLANPPASFETLIKEFPESALVNGTLGNRIAHGRAIQGGREAGKGRMTVKETEAHATSTLGSSKCGPILIFTLERSAGYVGDQHIRDVEALFSAVETMANANLDTAEGLQSCREAQQTYKDKAKAIHARAGAEAQAQRASLLAAEAKRNSNKSS